MPMLVVFEGLDGTGKTTGARRCAQLLDAELLITPSEQLRLVREVVLHTLGPSREAHQLFYLAGLFATAREASELLARGRSVVIDRYFLSNAVYGQFFGSSLDLDAVSHALPIPDVTVFMHASLEHRRQRIDLRGASEADVATLSVEAHERLMDLYAIRFALPIAGHRLVEVDSGEHDLAACEALVLGALGPRA